MALPPPAYPPFRPVYDLGFDQRPVPISIYAAVTEDNAEELAKLPLNADYKFPHVETGEVSENTLDKDQSLNQLQEERANSQWLKSEVFWKDRVGPGWEPVRVLGRGGNGIAGLWQFNGDGNSPKDIWSRQLQHVVVKQSRSSEASGLRQESEWMWWLNSDNENSLQSEHFPKLYRKVYRDTGAGTGNLRIDANRREVHRMLMEYCDGGDLHTFIRRLGSNNENWSMNSMLREDLIWSIFVCLAKGAVMLELGVEDPSIEDRPDDWEPLIHFDLKPSNIFIGRQDQGDHDRVRIHKIGDLGLMDTVKTEQKNDYMNEQNERGTPGWLAPEQSRDSFHFENGNLIHHQDTPLPLNVRRYDHGINTYGIGLIMQAIMTLNNESITGGRTFRSNLSSNLLKGDTIGENIVLGCLAPNSNFINQNAKENRNPLPYSKLLKALVLECLMQYPHYRPTPKQLLDRVIEGQNYSRQIHLERPLEMDDPPEQPDGNLQVPKSWIGDLQTELYYGLQSQNNEFIPLPANIEAQREDLIRSIQVMEARALLGYNISEHEKGTHRARKWALEDLEVAWVAIVVHLPRPEHGNRFHCFRIMLPMSHTVEMLKNMVLRMSSLSNPSQLLIPWAGPGVKAQDCRLATRTLANNEDITFSDKLSLNLVRLDLQHPRHKEGNFNIIEVHLHELGNALPKLPAGSEPLIDTIWSKAKLPLGIGGYAPAPPVAQVDIQVIIHHPRPEDASGYRHVTILDVQSDIFQLKHIREHLHRHNYDLHWLDRSLFSEHGAQPGKTALDDPFWNLSGIIILGTYMQRPRTRIDVSPTGRQLVFVEMYELDGEDPEDHDPNDWPEHSHTPFP